jgi:signal peptidase II
LKKQLYIVGIAVFLILLIDQIFKVWIKTSFNYYDAPIDVFGSWFRLIYIENQGMAFGTTLGSSVWAKLFLSIFRIAACVGIVYYFIKQWRAGVRTEFLFAIGLVFAGAFGNLIDSMFYDFIFKYDPCIPFNHLEGSGIVSDCGVWGKIETRNTGFLFGNVVDMFQFNVEWPSWVPWYDKEGDNQIFPAIWNVADASISVGIIFMLIRQKTFFPKKSSKTQSNNSSQDSIEKTEPEENPNTEN